MCRRSPQCCSPSSGVRRRAAHPCGCVSAPRKKKSMPHLRLRATNIFREALARTARVDFRRVAARRTVCFFCVWTEFCCVTVALKVGLAVGIPQRRRGALAETPGGESGSRACYARLLRASASPLSGEGRVRRMRRTHGHGCAGRPQRSRERSVADPNGPTRRRRCRGGKSAGE
jgi:hypothetical protein